MPPSGIPKFAWKRRYDNLLEAPGRPKGRNLETFLTMFPMIMRLRRYERNERKAGHEPLEFMTAPQPGPVMGVPLGGLGGGSINRGWRGDFPRMSFHPGRYHYGDVPANAFSMFVRRGGARPALHALRAERPESGSLSGWHWGVDAKKTTYYGLFPRAWTVYKEIESGITLTCRQVSPFLPGNYKDSSMPAGVFVWTIENTGEEPATVGLMLSWQNGDGGENDRAGGHWNEPFEEGDVSGVLLHHKARINKWADIEGVEDEPHWEDLLTFGLAAKSGNGVEVTHRARWITSSSGMDIWGDFREDGKLENKADPKPSSPDMAIGAAVAGTVEVPAGETREIVFTLAWDMPLARFGSGAAWYRRYTRFYGRGGDAAPAVARDALHNYPEWEKQIEAWQQPILDNPDLPDWYKTALFNELYYLVDGGTIWTDGAEGDYPPAEDQFGKFGYLEGHEYRMVNTYDVHYYASWALAMLFPELQLSIQRDFAEAIPQEDDEMRLMTEVGGKAPRKVAGAVPHDLGGPMEDPWRRVNIYNLTDISQWKDLNAKFALQVYRDFVITGRKDFLTEMWPAVKEAMAYIDWADLDEDGLIENNGPDQTYDTWQMRGPSAYCGALWLGALQVTALMADKMGEAELAARYRETLEKGKVSYEELLWTDEYYAFDTSPGRSGQVIMAGAMSGHWYIRACGLDPILPVDHVQSHLRKVYDFNVQKFEDGEMGAVNGMLPNGAVETSSMQPQEVWTGTTYSVAATMLYEGLREEAFNTAHGIYKMTYETLGYWFATPEAWNAAGDYRALSYMRPLAIWAMQYALEHGAGAPSTVEKVDVADAVE